jgi:hypothetical protein
MLNEPLEPFAVFARPLAPIDHELADEDCLPSPFAPRVVLQPLKSNGTLRFQLRDLLLNTGQSCIRHVSPPESKVIEISGNREFCINRAVFMDQIRRFRRQTTEISRSVQIGERISAHYKRN